MTFTDEIIVIICACILGLPLLIGICWTYVNLIACLFEDMFK